MDVTCRHKHAIITVSILCNNIAIVTF
uniref:Uncharacterized protein n=1 Tax=Lepeophtheirus salmonis TaxID=72036 RepID=A0A0K2T3S1_LEPSM